MSIYKERTRHTIYRKIYERHYGSIPKEENGRTYDIHHIDGDATNNDPSNLRAVTLQEHYDIHYSQGDWYACWKLAGKLQKSPMEISQLARLEANKRVANGTHHFTDSDWQRQNQKNIMANGDHHFIGDTNPVYDLIESGLHPWVGEKGSELSTRTNKERVENGTHNFLGPESNQKRIENGTHNWAGEIGSENAKKLQRKLVESGNHIFQRDDAPSQKQWTCEHCGKSGKGAGNYTRHHGKNCKSKP